MKNRNKKLDDRINSARLSVEDFNDFHDDRLFVVAGDLINALKSQLAGERSEIANLREQLAAAHDSIKKVNAQAEEFERKFFLEQDRAEAAEAKLNELERKLAEQQAFLQSIVDADNDGVEDCILVDRFLVRNELDEKKELNTLLAKAREEGRKEAVPDGWQVVPKEPTIEMVHQGSKCIYTEWAYRAMLAAAPKPEVEQ